MCFFSVDCDLGYYSVDKRQCFECGAGFYLSTGNRDSCDACPVGTNSQKAGLTTQLDCYRKYCCFVVEDFWEGRRYCETCQNIVLNKPNFTWQYSYKQTIKNTPAQMCFYSEPLYTLLCHFYDLFKKICGD